jgi:predicted RNase H-like HicB family nuclease
VRAALTSHVAFRLLESRTNDEVRRYHFARAGNNYSACAPDLPGCVSVGDSIEETEKNIKDAIEFHLEGMRMAGLAKLQPT